MNDIAPPDAREIETGLFTAAAVTTVFAVVALIELPVIQYMLPYTLFILAALCGVAGAVIHALRP